MMKTQMKIPLSKTEIDNLTKLFEQTFDYYCNHPEKIDSIEAQSYIINLNTVVGLSLTTVLAQQDLILAAKELINQFMQHHPFYQYSEQTKMLAYTVVSLVCCSTDLLPDLGYPSYGKDMLEALEGCIKHMNTKLGI